MDYTLFGDIERKLRRGFTYQQIKQYTGAEEKYIKMIDDYVKEHPDIDTNTRNKTLLTDIAKKYHAMLYKKFGVTGMLESSIRTTCCMLAGERYAKALQGEQLEKACEYMERIYQAIEKFGKE